MKKPTTILSDFLFSTLTFDCMVGADSCELPAIIRPANPLCPSQGH